MKILVKIGGTLLDSEQSRMSLAAEIASVARSGTSVAVVHGGGKQMTRFLADRGIESRFINGLRVTGPDVLDAVLKVLAGSVNKQLVAAFIACGENAVGLTGMDALLAAAEPLAEELGAVGRPIPSSGGLLNLLMQNNYVPVVACLGGDRQGHFYNVNADQMAVAVAASVQAEKLLFLTDVEGVKDKEGRVIPELSLDLCRSLIEEGIASGGMRAKLESAADAARAGIGEVLIAPGAATGGVRRLLDGEHLGSRLLVQTTVRSHA